MPIAKVRDSTGEQAVGRNGICMSEIVPVGNATMRAERPDDSETWFSTDLQLPAPRRLVLYETDRLIRLGYIDEMKQWRGLDGEPESQEVISWLVAKVALTI